MRLCGFGVDGFGMLHDLEVDALPGGLVVFYGPNEAGKSTLLAFLRGVLFGFPRGNTNEPKYEPVNGGRHGGRVTLLRAGDSIVVERFATRGRRSLGVTLPGGAAGGESDLVRILGGADRALFNSVFAFSLSELSELRTLTQKGISSSIFSAGIVGAGRDARGAIEALDSEAGALLKKRGRAGSRIADLAAEIGDVEGQLELARQAAHGYAALAREELGLQQRLDALQNQTDRVRGEGARYRKLAELWPIWSQICGARDALAALEPVGDFPADAAGRLDRARAGVENAEREREECAQELHKCALQLEGLQLDPAAARVSDEVLRLQEMRSAHFERLDQFPVAEQAAKQAVRRLGDALADLGPDWDARRLAEFDASIPRADEILQWKLPIGEAESSVAELEEQSRRLEQEKERAARRREREREQRDALGSGEGEALEERARALRALRIELAELVVQEARLPAQPSLWLAPLALAASVGCVALGANQIALGAGIAAAISVFHYIRWLRASRAPRDAIAIGQQRVENHAAQLDLPASPSQSELEACDEELERARLRRGAWERFEHARVEAEHEVRSGEAALRQLKEAMHLALSARTAAVGRWDEWKASAGLPQTLTPDAAPALFAAFRRGRELLELQRETVQERDKLVWRVNDWEEKARHVLAAFDEEKDLSQLAGSALVVLFDNLREHCEEDKSARSERGHLAAQRDDLQARLSRAEDRVADAYRALAQLFAEGGARDESEFGRRLSVASRRQELEQHLASGETQLRSGLGSGPDAERLLGELETGRLTHWENQAESHLARVDELREERDTALRQHRDAETALAELERSSEVADLELQREALREELRALAEEWRELRVARALIQRTLDRFERERQPEVLGEASRLFARVTRGRYERIVLGSAGDGDVIDSIDVLDSDARRKSPAQLSRGTAEQLYLCLRLGLIAEFARRSTSLPVVMDDVLVNFDDERARATAEVLADFALSRQVLFFTCSAHTRDLFQEVAPDADFRELLPS